MSSYAETLAKPITDDLRRWYRETQGQGPWFELTARIATAIDQAMAAERERCAKRCAVRSDNEMRNLRDVWVVRGMEGVMEWFAARIRSLGPAPSETPPRTRVICNCDMGTSADGWLHRNDCPRAAIDGTGETPPGGET